jgi:intein/homing endonuclease
MANENNSKNTIYQELNKLLNLDGFGFQESNATIHSQIPEESKIIIKGNSPEEIHRKGLEIEQKNKIKNKFFRTTDRSFQKALQYEAARLPAYMDYEGMEYYPIISSALDLFMEEATTIGINGKMLNVHSNKERIKTLLEDFFYNTVNVNVNLPFWTRNVVKYGDDFVLLYGERKKGITHVKQLVNYEIERFERIQNGKSIVKFKERMTGDEFNVFEIAHFRLLGDDKYLPYGSCLLSDTYVKTNKGTKQIKNIVKDDIVIGFDIKTQKKIETTVLDTIKSGKKEVFKISTKHNYIDSSKEHKFLIYDDNINNFRYEFVENLKIGDKLIINDSDKNDTIKNINKEEKVTIDRLKRKFRYYQNIDNIPNTITTEFAQFIGFMFGDGWISHNKDISFALGEYETQNLKYINLLEKFSGVKPKLIKPNIKVNYNYSQVNVGSKMLATILIELGFHGKFNEKRIPDWIFDSPKEIREAFLDGFVDADGSIFIDKWDCVRYSIELGNNELIKDLKYLVQSLGYKSGKISTRKRIDDKFIKGRKINSNTSHYFYFFKTINKQIKKYDVNNRFSNEFIVEPIISIENIGVHDVYDIHVDNENHNFFANNIVVHNSVLNKVRRVFRQLIMAEDAMLTYRIIRAGEKKVFKIDVGNIDEDDIEEYIYKVATTFKKVSQVNPNDGQIDYRFNILGNDEDYFIPVRNANTQTGIDTLPGACLSLETKIELLDGRSLELSEIITEFNSGKELWSYSINPKSGQIVPGKITWAGVTRKNTDVIKITLDNGESIICTPDHKFPTKFNGTKEAKDLIVGESMWAFNKKKSIIKGGSGIDNTYEMIYDHSTNDWRYTHRMVAHYLKENDLCEVFAYKIYDNNMQTIHHKDFNRYNNSPQNICYMNSKDHFYYHHDFAKEMYETYSDETKLIHKNLRKTGVKNYWDNITTEELQQKKVVAKNNSIKSRDKANKTFNNNPNKINIIKLRGESISKIKSLDDNKTKQSEIAKSRWKNTNLREIIIEKQSIKYSQKLLDLLIGYYNEYGRIDLILEKNINVNNSEWLNEFKSLNSNNKQLNKMTEITRNNIDKMLKYFGYSNWNDFKHKMPYYNHKIKLIEWLDEKQNTGTITIDGQEELHDYHTFALSCGIFTKNSNLDQIQDIEYLRDNLFIGLGVPKPFLSFQDAAGGGKNLAQYDIRFAKKINRIQQAMVQELNKMAIIHLYLLGYSGEDLNSFQITLTNPSTQQELLKSELLREKAQTYTELTRGENGIAAMSHTAAKRLVFNMSDKEIVEDLKQQKMEKVVMQELADSPVSIKKSGLFTDIDKRFGEPIEGMAISNDNEGGIQPTGSNAGSPMGGAPQGDKLGGTNTSPMGGEAGSPVGSVPPSGEMGGTPMMENRMLNNSYDSHVEKLVYGDDKEIEYDKNKQKEIIQENNQININLNKNAFEMINEIDQLLKNSETINKKYGSTENVEDIDFDNLDDI